MIITIALGGRKKSLRLMRSFDNWPLDWFLLHYRGDLSVASEILTGKAEAEDSWKILPASFGFELENFIPKRSTGFLFNFSDNLTIGGRGK